MSVVVPNPKRVLRVNSNIENVHAAIKVVANHVKPTTLSASIEVMNYYQFQSASKGLDMGMYLEICLHEIESGKTDIHMEVRRFTGVIDTAVEIDDAWGFINGCTNMLGKALRGEIK